MNTDCHGDNIAPRYSTLREYVNAQPRTLLMSDIAQRLGLKPNYLSQLLGGHRRVSRALALRLSKEHGISLEGLLDPSSSERLAS